MDISTGEDVSGLISHETRDPDRAMSVCHLKPNKEPIHKSPVELMCFAFLIKKWTGRLFAPGGLHASQDMSTGASCAFPSRLWMGNLLKWWSPCLSSRRPPLKNTRLLRTRCQDKRGGIRVCVICACCHQ